jgi:hypothetical protein
VYPVNGVCAHPDCTLPTGGVHHCFARSKIKGSSFFVAIYFDDKEDAEAFVALFPFKLKAQEDGERWRVVIPHAVGLCGSGTTGHHGDVESQWSWIRLEEGEWRWYDKNSNDEWNLVGALNPQPGSREGKPKRKKRLKGADRAQAQTWTVRGDGEDLMLLRDNTEELERRIQEHSGLNPRGPVYTMLDAVNYTLTHAGKEDF